MKKRIKIGICFLAVIMVISILSGCNNLFPTFGVGSKNGNQPGNGLANLADLTKRADVVVQLQDGSLVKTLLKGEEPDLYLSISGMQPPVNENENNILFFKKEADGKYSYLDGENESIFTSKSDDFSLYKNQAGETFLFTELLKDLGLTEKKVYNAAGETGTSFAGLQGMMDKSENVLYYDGFWEGYKDLKGTITDEFKNSDLFNFNISLVAKDSSYVFFITKNKNKYEYTGGEKEGKFTQKKGLMYENAKGDLINIKDLLR